MFVAACSILISLPVVAYHYGESLTPISFFLIYFVFAVILDSKIVLFTLFGILVGLVIASHIDDDPFSGTGFSLVVTWFGAVLWVIFDSIRKIRKKYTKSLDDNDSREHSEH
jgi:hypothetical protein